MQQESGPPPRSKVMQFHVIRFRIPLWDYSNLLFPLTLKLLPSFSLLLPSVLAAAPLPCQPAALTVWRSDCVCCKIKTEGFPGLVSLTLSQSISQPVQLTNDGITSECHWMAGGLVAGLTSPPSLFPIRVTFSLRLFCLGCATLPLMTVCFQGIWHSLACNIPPQTVASVTLDVSHSVGSHTEMASNEVQILCYCALVHF